MNTVLHTVMPVAVVLEWLVAPPQTKLGSKQLLQVQIFPLLYVTYTLIRGAIAGWYPYPFLNPENVGGYGGYGGYGGVVAYSAAIAAVCFVISGLLFKAANKLN